MTTVPVEIPALAAIVAALFVGVITPGPSFVMVARTTLASSRAHGVAVSLGMGIGGALFATAALSGLQLVFNTVPTLYIVLKTLGGAYLIWLGIRIWRSSTESIKVTQPGLVSPTRLRRSFLLGLSTQLSNPKTSIVYVSVFATFLPTDYSFAFAVAVVASSFMLEISWYSIVSLVLSSDRPRSVYLNSKMLIDRVAGTVMMALGAKLMLSSNRL